MEKTETTIFVDWENLLADLKAIQETDERLKEPNFNFNNPEQLLALIRSFLEPEEELKRIYFYYLSLSQKLNLESRAIKKKNLRSIKRIILKNMRKK
ncbi:NYN domain-containing protein [Helicobacter pylori]|nr:NYN domain-containing protein [Helicobacter pylori]